MTKVTIYSDGACRGNPGKGGWGAVIIPKEGQMSQQYRGYSHTTNNRMELLGAIIPLESLTDRSEVQIYSDSRYLCDAINKNWLKGWMRNGWVTSQKTPVKNKDLWLRMVELMKKHSVRFVWVKGHAGNQYNEIADVLANKGIDEGPLCQDEGFGS